MNKKFILKSSLLIISVLIIGYMQNILFLLNSKIYSNYITAVPLNETSMSCSTETQTCSKHYNFKIFAKNFSGKSLIVGNVFTVSSWFCDHNKFYATGNESFITASKSTHNEFFIIDTNILNQCNNSNEFEAIVSYPISQKKSGLLAEKLFLAPPSVAIKIKAAAEFVTKDYKVINLCMMICVLIFTFLIKTVAVDKSSDLRLKISYFLMLGAFAQSCLLEVIFPFDFSVQIDRWFGAISYCSYLTFGFYYLGTFKNLRPPKVLYVLSFYIVLMLGFGRITGWIYISFFAATTIIIIAFLSKRIIMIGYGILAATTAFDFAGFSYLPNSYIVPTFLAILILAENQKAFLSYLKINRLLKLSRSRGNESLVRAASKYRSHSIIKLFQRQFKIGKITILNLSDSEAIQIQQYFKDSAHPDIKNVDELPPIFAHTVTSGNALIHVHKESKVVKSIRRNDTENKANSPYFTILPIFMGKEIIGAIALTEYDSEQFTSSLNRSTFLFCLDILKGMLVEHLLTAPKTESLNKIAKLNSKVNLHDFSGCNTLEELISEFGGILNHTFGWRIISATLPTSDYLLKVGKTYSLDPAIEKQILAGKIYAHEDNLQGPLAIAVHEKKPVIVPNTKWLEGVIHPNTVKFFNIHSTKTAAFIPVLGPEGTTVGVYWIEGVRENEISYSDRELFNSFIQTISERLKLMKSNSKLKLSHQSLAQFLPKHLVDDYLNGKDVKEDDYGFLLMFDLKGSTRLSHAIGNKEFHSEVEKLKNIMQGELEPSNWVLQQYVWDGFEFTYSSPEDKSEILNVDEWNVKVETIFMSWKNDLIQRLGSRSEISELSYRLCFTYGDVSRGIVEEGATQKWTFTGNAMAVVSKVEQAAKHLQGKTFCDHSMLKRSNCTWVKLHTSNQGLDVYGLKEAIQTKIAA